MSTTDIDLGMYIHTCQVRCSLNYLPQGYTPPACMLTTGYIHELKVGGVNNATMRAYTYVPLTSFVPVKEIDLIEPAGFHETATHCCFTLNSKEYKWWEMVGSDQLPENYTNYSQDVLWILRLFASRNSLANRHGPSCCFWWSFLAKPWQQTDIQTYDEIELDSHHSSNIHIYLFSTVLHFFRDPMFVDNGKKLSLIIAILPLVLIWFVP